MSDLINRADAIEAVRGLSVLVDDKDFSYFEDALKALPSADAVQGWIPCSERLPEDIRPVLVTWKNTDPASYYQYIVGKHFIGTAHYSLALWQITISKRMMTIVLGEKGKKQ